MTGKTLALILSTTVALAACNNKAAETNVAANDLNAATPAGNTAAEGTNTAASAKVDSAFVTDGIKGDIAEIAIGELAASKGATKAVKDFGHMLATDHGAHKQKLIELARSAGIAVPTEPAAEGHANLVKLQGLSGAAFDKAFAGMMVDSHKKGIAKNEAQAKSGDPKTAKLAEQTLPTLRKHLGIAESLAK